MKKTLILIVAAALLVMSAGSVGAQSSMPPTILSFASDLATISVPDAEAGTTQATLTWHVAHVNESHKVLLYAYQLNGWLLLAGEEQVLPPVAGIIVNVTHPGTFAPPTYRLAVADANGVVVDERIVVIAYAAEEVAPTIAEFSTNTQDVDRAALADGSARVQVSWKVANRTSLTQLAFVQVMPDGSTPNVELPRATLWISSQGEGMVAPVDPGEGEPVTLRLLLVNGITGEVYDEVSFALGGAPAEEPAEEPAETPETTTG